MLPKRKVQLFITSIAVIACISHLVFPILKIDAITITLFIVAVIPWLEPLLKSVELPGGLKMEFQDLEKVAEEAKEAGIIKEKQEIEASVSPKQQTYDFIELAPINQQLALVSLRIEIEKRLKSLAEKYSVDFKNPSMFRLIERLKEQGILSTKETSVFRDMLSTLNYAAHGVEYDPRNADWIITNGPEILENLDLKLEVRGGNLSIGRSNQKSHWIDKSYEECDKSTTYSWGQCIGTHSQLWEKELENIYNSLIKRLKSPQVDHLIASQSHWHKQIILEKEFIYSFKNLQIRVGSGGKQVIALNFMGKVRARALELEEVLNLFVDKN